MLKKLLAKIMRNLIKWYFLKKVKIFKLINKIKDFKFLYLQFVIIQKNWLFYYFYFTSLREDKIKETWMEYSAVLEWRKQIVNSIEMSSAIICLMSTSVS